MKKFKYLITSDEGLHARPAAEFCKTANKFKSSVTIIKDGDEYEGKSILMVMSMGAVKGDLLEIIVNGIDENEASDELIKTLNME